MRSERAAAVLLAAGAGARFGGGKLDAKLRGARIGARAWSTLSEFAWLASGVVVPDSVPAFAVEAGAPLIANPEASSGMASSLHRAVAFARHEGADALLIALADMPFVSRDTLAELLAVHDSEATSAAAVLHGSGVPGAPALIGSGCFEDLLEIQGDRGAGSYLASRQVALLNVDPAELRDIDHVADLIS